jgi:diguanylate cyclase (GGDEF)-like protein
MAVVALAAALALPLVAPILAPELRRVYGDTATTAPFLVLALALMRRGWAASEPAERQFWRLLSAALACWLAQQLFNAATYTQPVTLGWSLGQDLLYAAMYLFLVLALDAQPHLRASPGAAGELPALRRAGAVAFVFGLIAYLLLVPVAAGPESYWAGGPSFTLYVFFDGYLVLRLVAAARNAVERRWRVTYRLLLATCAAWTLLDAVEGLAWAEILPPLASGSAWDLPWLVPLVTLTLAARSRSWGEAAPADERAAAWRREGEPTVGSPLVLLALLVPLLHLTVYTLGIFGDTTRRAHEAVVFGLLAVLGGLVFAYQRALERRNRALDEERRAALAQVEHQALHDPLTNLANRRLLWDRMGQAMAEAARRREHLGLVFVDLDEFKAVNDARGHAAGDEILRRIAERLTGQVRSSDTVARVGGDEFVVLLTGVADRETVQRLAAKIRHAFDAPFTVAGVDLRVGASVGVSLFPEDGTEALRLLAAADAAMYRAKGERPPPGERAASSPARDQPGTLDAQRSGAGDR